jgi:hypothetical protein
LSDLKTQFELFSNFDGRSINSKQSAEEPLNKSEIQLSHNLPISFVIPDQSRMKSYEQNLFPTTSQPRVNNNSVIDESREKVLKYLTSVRGLSEEALLKYSVGFAVQQFLSDEKKTWIDHVCITFPWIRMWCDDTEIGVNDGNDKVIVLSEFCYYCLLI